MASTWSLELLGSGTKRARSGLSVVICPSLSIVAPNSDGGASSIRSDRRMVPPRVRARAASPCGVSSRTSLSPSVGSVELPITGSGSSRSASRLALAEPSPMSPFVLTVKLLMLTASVSSHWPGLPSHMKLGSHKRPLTESSSAPAELSHPTPKPFGGLSVFTFSSSLSSVNSCPPVAALAFPTLMPSDPILRS